MNWSLPVAALAAVLLSVPLLPERAPRAGTALRMDVETLVDTADLVLEGRVLATQARLDSRGRIVTDHELSVSRTWYGEPLARRTVRLPGGVLPEGRGLLIPGAPTLEVGDELVLCLSEAGDDDTRWVTGLSQGKFRLVRSQGGAKQALRSGAAHLMHETSGALLEPGGAYLMDYAELAARIEAAANARRAREGESR